jgi:hypothetical protein
LAINKLTGKWVYANLISIFMLTHSEAGRESLLALAWKILGAFVSLRKAALQLNLEGCPGGVADF